MLRHFVTCDGPDCFAWSLADYSHSSRKSHTTIRDKGWICSYPQWGGGPHFCSRKCCDAKEKKDREEHEAWQEKQRLKKEKRCS